MSLTFHREHRVGSDQDQGKRSGIKSVKALIDEQTDEGQKSNAAKSMTWADVVQGVGKKGDVKEDEKHLILLKQSKL